MATATFEFANGYATVTVKTTADHILAPGFHSMHIHGSASASRTRSTR